ncbi:MAG: restriction endonuclease subunit S, partial [Verrucomicrobiota bacterium]
MSFTRYQQYKDSGVEWWGDMPDGWSLFPAKRSFSRKKELNVGMKCENRLSLTLGGVVPRALDDLDGLQASEFETYQIFSADDLVFKLIDLQNIKTSRVGLVPKIGIMSPAYIRVEPDKTKVTPKFAYWFFTNLYNRCIFNELGGGVRQTISSEELLLLPFPALPLPEQAQIAAFLDRETAKIDDLVAEQRRLMDLLKEKRQAVISHAVTRGLNPDAPMKPSGIEWLGDVPEHWDTRTIAKASTKITNGFVGPTRDILVEAGTPYIQATHIKNGRVNFDEGYFVRPDWSAAHSKSILCEGDVLIVQTGAGTGDVGLVSAHEVGYNCHALIIVAPDRKLLHGTYLSAVLQSTYGQEKLTSIETGAMHPHLNCGEVKFVEVPLPPLAEQSD